jgi:hypothetical protein
MAPEVNSYMIPPFFTNYSYYMISGRGSFARLPLNRAQENKRNVFRGFMSREIE